MADGMKTTTRSGKVRGPNLSDPQLRIIGTLMVKDQKERWAKHINAEGQPAKKLSVKYAIIKQQLLHKRPYRDMVLTGKLLANFSLRRAANNRIRAENTTRLDRAKAQANQLLDQMIGFAVSDIKDAINNVQVQYGQWAKTAWIPLGNTRGAPRR